MKPRILLVNPPIYDFTAYDFWLRPLGLLTIAGMLRGKADMMLFDFLDRQHPFHQSNNQCISDKFGRGKFPSVKISRPKPLESIPRIYRRFGLPKHLFEQFLRLQPAFDFALIPVMTYWYPGYREVIDTIRQITPQTKIIIGGTYTILCPDHAAGLGADLTITGIELEQLRQFLNAKPDSTAPPLWEAYPKLETAAMKLSTGCSFKCTYCSVPQIYGFFRARPAQDTINELTHLARLRPQDNNRKHKLQCRAAGNKPKVHSPPIRAQQPRNKHHDQQARQTNHPFHLQLPRSENYQSCLCPASRASAHLRLNLIIPRFGSVPFEWTEPPKRP